QAIVFAVTKRTGKQNTFADCKDGDRRNNLQSQKFCRCSRSLKILISNHVIATPQTGRLHCCVASSFHQNSSLSTSPIEVISTTIVNKAGPSHPKDQELCAEVDPEFG